MDHTIPRMHKVYNLGHRNLERLYQDTGGVMIVQEKIDGSQFSWMWDEDGKLYARSKRTVLVDAGVALEESGLFWPSVSHLLAQDAGPPGIVFRGEAVAKPRHNTMTYERTPNGHTVLYGIDNPSDNPSDYENALRFWAAEFGIEATREFMLTTTKVLSIDDMYAWIDELRSILGGPVEGVVIKNYRQFDPMTGNKPLMAKIVRPEFKEKHTRQFKSDNPSAADVIESIIESLNTEARFEKAVQHLRDAGELEASPRDIGALMKEVKSDTLEEERDWIIEQLVNYAMPKITRRLGRGLPEWFKDKLARGEIETGA